MTQPNQPPFSGAPTPVSGVTGGPPVLGGQISNDPTTGNIVVAGNPGNVFQIRKGNTPQALQVYEYFHTNTDFSRLSLNAQTGGPFQLSVETLPASVIRDLQIIAPGIVSIPNLSMTRQFITGTLGGLTAGQWSDLPGTTLALVAGTYLITSDFAVQVGTTGAIVQTGIVPVSTGSTGTPSLIQGLVGVGTTTAGSYIILPMIGVVAVPVGASYKAQMSINAGVGNAVARWSGLKIG